MSSEHLDEYEDDFGQDDTSVGPHGKKTKKKRDGSTLRKAPQAPKRFKSSYICFFMAKQREIKEALGEKASVTEISKRSAHMWRSLPPEERSHWDDVAAKDKQRYMVEKASYTGPWQVPWKRAKKDPSAPKRPMSAFLYFSQGKRRQIKEVNPSMKNTEVSRILGEMWRTASDVEKRPHIEQEILEREKYKVAIADWRRGNDLRLEKERRAHEENSTDCPIMLGDLTMESPHHEQVGHQNEILLYPRAGSQVEEPQSHARGQNYLHPLPQPYPQAYHEPQVGSYHYPANGKQHPVIILGPSGMPRYPPPQQPPQPQEPAPMSYYYYYGGNIQPPLLNHHQPEGGSRSSTHQHVLSTQQYYSHHDMNQQQQTQALQQSQKPGTQKPPAPPQKDTLRSPRRKQHASSNAFTHQNAPF